MGVKNDTKPISVLLPEDLDAYVRSKPNRSEWLRQIIAEAMDKELAEGCD
ncbi:ribbon-helix-helix domain-containing protein [Nostoc sp. CENA543]|nr:ribbon-helix-helix domain-containing protein [Nostoc sp. CENA543]